MALKVVKSAAHYTETALDEIKLLKCVSLGGVKIHEPALNVYFLCTFRFARVMRQIPIVSGVFSSWMTSRSAESTAPTCAWSLRSLATTC